MSTNNSISALLRQLEIINDDLRERPRQIKQAEKELQLLYDDLCDAYFEATPEQRVDALVVLEYRTALVAQLFVYYKRIVSQAVKATHKKRQDHLTRQVVRQGAAAGILLGRKVTEPLRRTPDEQLSRAAEAAELDLNAVNEQLDVPYKYFIQRALQYHKGHQRIRALKSLGIALQKNPALEDNDRVLALAATLTGETELSAIYTLSDAYVLRKFVEDLEEAEREELSRIAPQQRSTLDTIRSWFAG